MIRRIPRLRRARVFGRDPEAYDRARLPYPAALWELLESRYGLREGASVLEIGPGTGIATRELLRRGARPLTLVEPDRRLVRFLRQKVVRGRRSVTIVPQRFERARLRPGSFDLVVAATSFHWLPLRPSLRRVARLLRPGGWWVSWNTHHGDPYRPSRFHDALQPLYRELRGRRGPSDRGQGSDRRERARRFDALRASGEFDRIRRADLHWSAVLSATQLRALWASFSDIQTLPPTARRWFLAELTRLVRQEFHGRVRLRILTPIYSARRRREGLRAARPSRPRRPRRGSVRRPSAGGPRRRSVRRGTARR